MKIGQKYFVNLTGWYFAPDGKKYSAIYGTYLGRDNDNSHVIGRATIPGNYLGPAFQCSECRAEPYFEWARVYDSKAATVFSIPCPVLMVDHLPIESVN